MIFRNSVEINKINEEYVKLNTLIGDLKVATSVDDARTILTSIGLRLEAVSICLDKLDKTWVKKAKFGQVASDLDVIIRAYNQAKIDIATRSIATPGFVIPAGFFDATDDKFLPTEISVNAYKNYFNNPNNLRVKDQIHGVVTRSLAVLLLGATVLTSSLMAKSIKDNQVKTGAYESLKDENTGLSEQLKQLNLDLTIARAEVALLNKQLENATPEKVKELQEKLSAAEAKVAQLEEEIKAKDEKYNLLNEQYEAIKKENEGLKSENSELSKKVTDLENEIEEKKVLIESLESSEKALNEKVAQLEKELKAAEEGGNKTQIDELRRQLAEARSNYNTLKDAYDLKVNEYQELLRDYGTLSNDLKKEQEKNKFLQDNLDNATKELNRLVNSVDTVYKACYADDGKDIDSVEKLDKIVSYYKTNYKDATSLKDFLAAFIANVEGVSYDTVRGMSVADLIDEAEKIVNMLQEASKNPADGNVREDESKKPESSGEVKDPEPVTPDIPVRE